MYLQLHSLSIERSESLLFSDVSLVLHAGETLVVLGPNGSGKSSLLECLEGRLAPSAGNITMPLGISVGVLRQIPSENNQSVFETLRAIVPDHILDESIYQALIAVGLVEQSWTPINKLSLGQRSRVYLSQLALPYQLLLVDEPTNHLDQPGVELLIELLKRSAAIKCVVTHHQHLAKAVATSVLDLSGTSAKYYQMDYEEYQKAKSDADALLLLRAEEAKAEAEALQKAIAAKKVQAKAIHERSTHFYYRAKAATIDRQSVVFSRRIARIERAINVPTVTKPIRFPPLPYLPTSGVLAYLPGPRGSVSLHHHHKLWLQGPNGSGKSTLLSKLARELAQSNRSYGYLPQSQDEMKASVKQWLGDTSDLSLPTLLARIGLPHTLGNQSLSKLSPGVRQRLALLKLSLNPSSLLLLDEPTNHLDIPTQQALAASLASWPGAMVIVSHDPGFVKELGITTTLELSAVETGKD